MLTTRCASKYPCVPKQRVHNVKNNGCFEINALPKTHALNFLNPNTHDHCLMLFMRLGMSSDATNTYVATYVVQNNHLGETNTYN